MQISGSTPYLFQGTITAGGTLTDAIDLSDASLFGLIVNNMTTGTLTFEASPFGVGHAEYNAVSSFVEVREADGTALEVTGSGNFAVDMQTLAKLSTYQHLRIKTSVAQTTGVKFYLPARG